MGLKRESWGFGRCTSAGQGVIGKLEVEEWGDAGRFRWFRGGEVSWFKVDNVYDLEDEV